MAFAAAERGGSEDRRRRPRGRSDRTEALRSRAAAGAWGSDYEWIARSHPSIGGWDTPK